MAESQAKIRLTLDGQQAIREAEKVKKGIRGVAEEGRGWAAAYAKTLAFSGALVGTLRQIVAAQNQARDAAAAMGESIKGAAQAEIALSRTRLNATQIQATLAAARGGVRSEEEVLSFAKRLGKDKRLTAGKAINAARTFATGLASDEEILTGRGVSQDEIDRRSGMLSEDAKTSLAAQRIEVLQQQRRRASTGTGKGLGYLLAQEAEKTRAAESPVLSSAKDAANTVTQFVTFGAVDTRDAVAVEQLKELRNIRSQMFPKPQTGSRGEP